MRRQGIPYTPGEPLPLQPGDVVYSIDKYHYYEIREKKIHGVAVYDDRCCVVLDTEIFDIATECSINQLYEVFFPTREDAENWKKKHLTDPPYEIGDCTKWVSPEMYVPEKPFDFGVYVKVQTPEGIIKRTAYYDDGSEYPEDKGFWDGTGRRSNKIDNVIAWIDSEHYDKEDDEAEEDDE